MTLGDGCGYINLSADRYHLASCALRFVSGIVVFGWLDARQRDFPMLTKVVGGRARYGRDIFGATPSTAATQSKAIAMLVQVSAGRIAFGHGA
jgi:hypothetical protein